MSNYSVSVIFDACKSVNVEADSPEEAIDIAYDEAGYASLCHQCSSEIDVGDAVRAIAYDESGKKVIDDGLQEAKLSKLTQQRDELLALLECTVKAWEVGDNIVDGMIKAKAAIAKAKGIDHE